MTAIRPRPAQTGCRTFGTLMALMVLATLAPLSAAQQYIGQNGRLFDRNTQIGGNGQNATRPVSPLLSGNAVATGNVGRGFSLHSVSPIGSTLNFGASLGSSTLSNFRRDSVSVADRAFQYGGLTPRVYYDPARTVFTPRYFGAQRTATPGLPSAGSQFGSRSVPIFPRSRNNAFDSRFPGQPVLPQPPLDFRIDSRVDRTSALRSQIVGLSPGSTGALGSSIFGATAPPIQSAESLLPVFDRQRPGMRAPLDLRADGSDPIDSNLSRPLGERLGEPLGTPLDMIVRGADANTLLDRSGRGLPGGGLRLSVLPGLQADSQARAAQLGGGQRVLSSQSPVSTPLGMPQVLGLDKFTDLQLAMALSQNPNAAWFGEMKRVVAANPELAINMQQVMDMDAAQFADAVINMPIQTFVGRGNSALNESLMRAEALLQSRDYFDAASQYDRAHLLDPGNPLPLIGKGHASLGAGDYQTAVHNILLGLQRYPEMTRLHVDLKAFMGGEAIDIRRADLMRRLEKHEDTKLRFLLGYLEYNSGRTKSGLAHLKKAAAHAPVGSFIYQFPALLSGKQTLPPPKLPLSPVLGPAGGVAPVAFESRNKISPAPGKEP